MAKNMARLDENNVVINIEWCSDKINETNNLVNAYDYLIEIGDIYENGKFYHDGEQVLTPLEAAYQIINEYIIKEEELDSSYQEGINSI